MNAWRNILSWEVYQDTPRVGDQVYVIPGVSQGDLRNIGIQDDLSGMRGNVIAIGNFTINQPSISVQFVNGWIFYFPLSDWEKFLSIVQGRRIDIE